MTVIRWRKSTHKMSKHSSRRWINVELCTDMGLCNYDFVSIEQFRKEINEIISSSEGADKDNNNNI